MNDKTVSEMRSEVIESFIGLEACIDAVIGIHYLGKLSMAFYEEVLYDEYFSFGLKARILEKILCADGDPQPALIQRLRRLNNIRNIFAHCGVQRYDSATKRSYTPNPRKLDTALDFGELHSEFVGGLAELRDYLLEAATRKGAVIKLKEGGRWVDFASVG